MSSIKCPNCGLTNFATATACKRCKHNLEARAYPYWNDGGGAVEPPKPDWSKLQTQLAVPVEDLSDYGDGSHPAGNYIFAIYLAICSLFALNSLRFLSSTSTRELWKLATDPDTKLYLPSFAAWYYLMVSGAVMFLIVGAILLVTLFLKMKMFLRWVVIYLLAEFAYFAYQAYLVFNLELEIKGKNIRELDLAANQLHWLPYFSFIGILLTFIWFRYYTSSKRARLVFQQKLSELPVV